MVELIMFDLELMKKQREKQSASLTDFYRHWWEHKDDKNKINKQSGLCSLANSYMVDKRTLYIKGEMTKQFQDCGLDSWFPFGRSTFYESLNKHEMNKDPNRLEWVRLHIPELNT